jgi:hypothetical protein
MLLWVRMWWDRASMKRSTSFSAAMAVAYVSVIV